MCGTYQNEKLYDTGCDATMTQSQLAKTGVCLTIFININQKKNSKTHAHTHTQTGTLTRTHKQIKKTTTLLPHTHTNTQVTRNASTKTWPTQHVGSPEDLIVVVCLLPAAS